MKNTGGKDGDPGGSGPGKDTPAGTCEPSGTPAGPGKAPAQPAASGDAGHENWFRYRMVADFTCDWEYWSDPLGKILYISPSAETILRRPVSSYTTIEELVRAVVHPDDQPARLRHLEEEMKGTGPSEMEFRIVRPGGEVRWIHHVCQPVLSPDGRFSGTRGSNRDITDRHAAEEAVKLSNRRLSEVLSSIQDDFYVLDQNWNFVFANLKFTSRIGKSPEDFLGNCIWDMFPKHRGTIYEENLRAAMEKQEVRRFEIPGQYTDAWYSMTVFPSSEGITVLGTDITDRKQAEKALLERDRQLRADLDAMKILRDIGLLYIHEGNLEPVLTQVVDAAIAITGSDFGNIQLIDPRSMDLRIVAHRNFPAWWIDFWNNAGHGQGACGTALRRGERVIIGDVEESPVFAGTTGLDAQRRAGVRAVTSTPLVSRKGVLLGMFSTHFSRPWKPDDRQIRLLDLLARQAADIIERAQSERTLRESEERQRLLVGTMLQGVVHQDAGGRVISMNPAAEQILGKTPEEFLGKTSGSIEHETIREDGSIFPGKDHPAMVALQTGKQVRQVVMGIFNPREKAYRWISIDAVPLFRPGEERPYQVYTVFEDITERRKAEAEQRQSEADRTIAVTIARERQRLFDVLETLPIYVCLLDKDYRMPFANRYFRETFRAPEGRQCYDFLFNLETPCETCESYKVMKTRAPHHWFWTGPNGRDYDIYDFPFVDADGSFMILEMGIDITERRKAEEEVRRANMYNRNLIEASLDPLITIRPDGTIGDVNDATIRVTGLSREELLGTDFAEYFTDPKKAKAGYELAFRCGSVTDYELEIRSRDGRVTPVLYNATVFRDAAGKIAGVFAAARDITALREAKAGLQKEHDLLEERVRSRTDELARINAYLKDEISQRKHAEALVKKTVSELHAAIESTADGIYVIDRGGKIIRYNQNFASMWKIPEELLKSRNNRNVIEFMKTQVKNPDQFAVNDENGKNRDRETFEMLELTDGRIFERYSKPQKMDAAIIGRVHSYRDVTDRRHAEERLLASLQEKETLIREIHHRVKNNLQIISGLLAMTRMRTQDDMTGSILTDMMMKIKTMAQIHTRLYESKQFDRINMGSQIREQVTDLSSIYAQSGTEISCEIDIAEFYLPVDRAIPCALIANEALSNAFKHAFRGRKSGMLQVSGALDGNIVRIVVQDNGTGIPAGIDVYETTSLGLKLIRNLALQLKGSVEIASLNGTRVTVEFPFTTG